ncbi:MAG: carboxypeptidase-like regulatory domain-containing protein [Planctomycetia bacterium]|nr:carboxypeptidase-like regulatory domain-containing protein [Planctomycetia bacterium]
MRVFQILPVSLCVAVVALFSGCGPANPLGVVDVSGTVTLDGQPVEGATVTFRAEDGTFGSGRTKADGTYIVTMAASPVPGLPKGSYKVKVVKKDIPPIDMEKLASGSGPDSGSADQKKTEIADLLPKKYDSFDSGLTANIEGATSDCNFELTSQ